MSEKTYLTTKELASRWGFSEQTIAQWRFRNKGPKYERKGYRTVIYFIDDITEFERQNPGFLPQHSA